MTNGVNINLEYKAICWAVEFYFVKRENHPFFLFGIFLVILLNDKINRKINGMSPTTKSW